MEIKKSEKASLENKKLLFVEIGLTISLAITLGAFEWTSTETKVSSLEDTTQIVTEEEIIPYAPSDKAFAAEILSLPVFTHTDLSLDWIYLTVS